MRARALLILGIMILGLMAPLISPAQATTAIFGNNSYYSNTTPAANELDAAKFTIPLDFDSIVKATFWGASASGTHNVKVVICNSLSQIVANGISSPVSITTTAAWRDATFSTPPTLTPGADYYFGVISDAAWLPYYIQATPMYYHVANNYASPSNPSFSTWAGHAPAIYITYNQAPPLHTITASSGSHGSINPSGAVSVSEGDDQPFTFSPDPSYHVSNMIIDSSRISVLPDSYTFVNVLTNHTILVDFGTLTFPRFDGFETGGLDPSIPMTADNNQGFTTTDPYNGTYSLTLGSHDSNYGTYNQNVTGIGEDLKLTAFIDFPEPGAYPGLITPVTFSDGSSLNRIHFYHYANDTAFFQLYPVSGPHFNSTFFQYTPGTWTNLTLLASLDGTFNLEFGGVNLLSGSYYLGSGSTWYSAGFLGSPYTGLADTRIDDLTIDKIYYAITPSAGSHGSISPDVPTLVLRGGSLDVSWSPDPGYEVATVLVDGSSVSITSPYSFTNVQTSHTIDVVFSLIPIPPVWNTWSFPANGTLLTDGTSYPLTVNATDASGDLTSLQLDLYPWTDQGYGINQVYLNLEYGAIMAGQWSYSYEADTSSKTTLTGYLPFNSTWWAWDYNTSLWSPISAPPSPLLNVTGSTAWPDRYGGAATLSFTPNATLQGGLWEIDGYAYDPADSAWSPDYYVFNVTGSPPIQYTITPSAGSHGSISPDVPTLVNSGDNLNVVFTPDPGYGVLDYQVDGVSLGAAPGMSFTNVTANHAINVDFTLATSPVFVSTSFSGNTTITPGSYYTVTANVSDPGGTLSAFYIQAYPNNSTLLNTTYIDLEFARVVGLGNAWAWLMENATDSAATYTYYVPSNATWWSYDPGTSTFSSIPPPAFQWVNVSNSTMFPTPYGGLVSVTFKLDPTLQPGAWNLQMEADNLFGFTYSPYHYFTAPGGASIPTALLTLLASSDLAAPTQHPIIIYAQVLLSNGQYLGAGDALELNGIPFAWSSGASRWEATLTRNSPQELTVNSITTLLSGSYGTTEAQASTGGLTLTVGWTSPGGSGGGPGPTPGSDSGTTTPPILVITPPIFGVNGTAPGALFGGGIVPGLPGFDNLRDVITPILPVQVQPWFTRYGSWLMLWLLVLCFIGGLIRQLVKTSPTVDIGPDLGATSRKLLNDW